EGIVLRADVIEEDVGRLAAKLYCHRNEVLGRILHDEAARRRLAGEGDRGDAVRGSERLARFEAEAVDDVEHALRNEIADELEQNHDRSRGLFGGLENDAVSSSQRW